ncbi:DUF4249 family protein [Limibacter armeniacum]|uniref:DUF4249 family protein n=1 Tax=Limibacter armeniacum TaxID=466084 RepID=UPI002FE652DE
MTMTIKKYMAVVLLAFTVIQACTTFETYSEYEPLPVVEGYLKAGSPISIKVTEDLPFGAEDSTFVTLDDLEISIGYGSETYTMTAEGEGIYSLAIIPQEGETYTMSFEHNGIQISGYTTIPYHPENFNLSTDQISVTVKSDGYMERPQYSDPVYSEWTGDADDYYLVVLENLEEAPVSILELSDDEEEEDIPMRGFRSQPVQGLAFQIMPQSFNYYGDYNVILYHLNADYASLYEDNSSELSSISLSPPPSNIENGLGIFTGMSTDTLTISVTD